MPNLPLLKCVVNITRNLQFTFQVWQHCKNSQHFFLDSKRQKIRIHFCLGKNKPQVQLVQGRILAKFLLRHDGRSFRRRQTLSAWNFDFLFSFSFSIWRSPCFSAVYIISWDNLGLGKCWLALFESWWSLFSSCMISWKLAVMRQVLESQLPINTPDW